MIFGRVVGRLRRRWRRVLAAVVAVSVLSGGGITAYGNNPENLIGRVLVGYFGAGLDRCAVPSPESPGSLPRGDSAQAVTDGGK